MVSSLLPPSSFPSSTPLLILSPSTDTRSSRDFSIGHILVHGQSTATSPRRQPFQEPAVDSSLLSLSSIDVGSARVRALLPSRLHGCGRPLLQTHRELPVRSLHPRPYHPPKSSHHFEVVPSSSRLEKRRVPPLHLWFAGRLVSLQGSLQGFRVLWLRL